MATRPLTSGEIALAQSIYGENIDLSVVTINSGTIPFQPQNTYLTTGNTINVGSQGFADFSDPSVPINYQATFIHELDHVLQNQDGINVAGNVAGLILQYGANAQQYQQAYYYSLSSVTNFNDLNVEQQAALVQDYFLALKGQSPIHNTDNNGAIAQDYLNIIPPNIVPSESDVPLPPVRPTDLGDGSDVPLPPIRPAYLGYPQDPAELYQNQMPQPTVANGGIAQDYQPESNAPNDYSIGNPGALYNLNDPGVPSSPSTPQTYTIPGAAPANSTLWNADAGGQGGNSPATPGQAGAQPDPIQTDALPPTVGGQPTYVDASGQTGLGDSTVEALAPDNWAGSLTGTGGDQATQLYLGGQGSGLGGDTALGGSYGQVGGSYGQIGGSYGQIGGSYGQVGGSFGGSYGPVVLDLTGGGIKITPKSSSNFFYDMAGDGRQDRTAWAGAGNGVLVLDLNNNSQITFAFDANGYAIEDTTTKNGSRTTIDSKALNPDSARRARAIGPRRLLAKGRRALPGFRARAGVRRALRGDDDFAAAFGLAGDVRSDAKPKGARPRRGAGC